MGVVRTWLRRKVEFPLWQLLLAGGATLAAVGGQWYRLEHPPPMGWSARALRALTHQEFLDGRGQVVRLHTLASDPGVFVLWFDYEGCPIYRFYLQVINEYASSPGVRWVGIVHRATPEMVATLASGEGLRFPLWVDPRGDWRRRTPIPLEAPAFALWLRDGRVRWVDYFLPTDDVELEAWRHRLAVLAGMPRTSEAPRLFPGTESWLRPAR
jgi:hypothetical protein